jgi:hypothetical protein
VRDGTPNAGIIALTARRIKARAVHRAPAPVEPDHAGELAVGVGGPDAPALLPKSPAQAQKRLEVVVTPRSK